jgi:transcriptional regulator with XRE-family HTH domain
LPTVLGCLMSDVVERLKKDFKDPEYRHVYDEGFSSSSIATQIKVLREARKWTQAELADKAGMNQSRISEIEDVNFSSWTMRTLRKLARAFDLRLKISFEEFGTLLTDFRDLNREHLSRRPFDSDLAFQPVPAAGRTSQARCIWKSRGPTRGRVSRPTTKRAQGKVRLRPKPAHPSILPHEFADPSSSRSGIGGNLTSLTVLSSPISGMGSNQSNGQMVGGR